MPSRNDQSEPSFQIVVGGHGQYPTAPYTDPGKEAKVPPRIQVAAGILFHFGQKTANVPLPLKLGHDNEIAFEPMKGQVLTACEMDLHDACCDTIKKYIEGNLSEVGVWDRPRTDPTKYMNLRIPCPGCGGNDRRQQNCSVCGGSGRVRIGRDTDGTGGEAVGPKGEEEDEE